MIRQTIFIVSFLIASCAFGQIHFHKIYSGNGYDVGQGIAQLPDSGFLVTGSSSSFEEAPSQVFLMRLDSLGEFMWSRAYGGAESEEGKRVMPIPGFGYYIAGTSSSGASENFDAYILFTNESGDLEWEVRTDNGGWERVHDAILLADTSMIVVGETNATPNERTDMYIVRYDKAGNLLWQQQLGDDGDDVLKSVFPASDTTFVIGGSLYVEDSMQFKGFVAKMHRDGTMYWSDTLGVEGNYWINDVCRINGGGVRAIGERIKTDSTDYDPFVAMMNDNGMVTYTEENYSQYDSRLTQFVQYQAGNTGKFYIMEQAINASYPTFPGGEDFYIFRGADAMYWDGYGWGWTGTGQDQGNDFKPTSDGHAVGVGYHASYGSGGSCVFVVKIAYDWVFPPIDAINVHPMVGIEETIAFKHLKVYPNPVVDHLTIELPESAYNYRMMDITGKEILKGDGFGKQELFLGSQPEGMYLVEITHPTGEVFTTKIMH